MVAQNINLLFGCYGGGVALTLGTFREGWSKIGAMKYSANQTANLIIVGD